jgi:hypothetical protein
MRATCVPDTMHQQEPSSPQARSGSMPGRSIQTGSLHGPSGFSAVTRKLPPAEVFVVISQKRPSWWRSVGA